MKRDRLPAIIRLPVADTARGLDRCLETGPRGLVLVALGLLTGWWIYVPCHELLHAAGCVATGGSVTRLELAPVYGGRILHRILTFVAADAGHPGRLAGFDTRGSDLVYLATDMAPFLLTLFPGVWALRKAGATARPFLFGVALPLALAPFLSLSGDAYEIGSILVTNLPPWSTGGLPAVLRGDDLLVAIARAHSVGGVRAPLGLGLAATLGMVWAIATYLAGAGLAALLGAAGTRPRLPRPNLIRTQR